MDIEALNTRLINSGFCHLRFSQLGEDGILLHYFHDKNDGFYVDIGAHHPFRHSNTTCLYELKNWQGINVEPDRPHTEILQQHRPRDINLPCAIGPETGKMEFFEFVDGVFNTVDPARVEQVYRQFGIRPIATRTINVITLDALFGKFLPPGRTIDYLNIDAEGLDVEILRSNDWSRYRPQLISVEDHSLDLGRVEDSATYEFLTKQGYGLHSHCVVTSFYERRE